MTESIITIRDLTKTFGDIVAVDNLNLEIYRGEMFALVGPDGAGKTTTVKMLCGITEPTSGRIEMMNMDLKKDIARIKRHIGYLSQRFSLYGDLSVDENIEFFAEIHSVTDYKTRREELLKFTRLTPFRKRLAERLSGGMKQKLALACTLIHTPEIIFLDEPTTGVDPVSRRDFWKILSSLLKGGMTVIMTTPYLDEAERCHRVGLMNKGRIMVADTLPNVKKLMKGNIMEIVCDEIRRAFKSLKNFPVAQEVQAFGDRLNVVVGDREGDPEKIRRHMEENNINVVHWRLIPPSLENVFISLIKTS